MYKLVLISFFYKIAFPRAETTLKAKVQNQPENWYDVALDSDWSSKVN